MLLSRCKGHKPQIVFTSDFHQLERGDLIPGPLVLRYDPMRVVPADEVARLPATRLPVHVEVRFHPEGGQWSTDMLFEPAARLQVDYDPTGHGTMLEIAIPLPDGCDELEFWFTYTDTHGQLHVDSAYGTNYWIRFPAHDLSFEGAAIRSDPQHPLSEFQLRVLSVPEVDSVTVRWRYTAYPNEPRQQASLAASAAANGGKNWAPAGGSLDITSGTPIAFDLVYTADGHKFTDDNEGTWYVVSPS